jgi:hypothetical protein
MIELRNFTKAYGDFVAVANLNLKIAAGELFGFIGPNGAGKSTTIRFLATLLRATAGEGIVNGHSVTRDPIAVRKSIGYMPDNFGVYDGMKVWEFLDFFAVAYEIPKSRRKAVIGDVLELLERREAARAGDHRVVASSQVADQADQAPRNQQALRRAEDRAAGAVRPAEPGGLGAAPHHASRQGGDTDRDHGDQRARDPRRGHVADASLRDAEQPLRGGGPPQADGDQGGAQRGDGEGLAQQPANQTPQQGEAQDGEHHVVDGR